MLTTIDKELDQEGLSQRDFFSELLVRLLDYGVICRDESQIEQQLYDRYVRLEELVGDYLSLLGIRIQARPPLSVCAPVSAGCAGAGHGGRRNHPGHTGLPQPSESERSGVNSGVARPVRQSPARRAGGRAGLCDGVTGSAEHCHEKSCSNVRCRITSPNAKPCFRRLKQLRLVQISNDDDLTNSDMWLRVRPMIMSYVSDQVLAELLEEKNTRRQTSQWWLLKRMRLLQKPTRNLRKKNLLKNLRQNNLQPE